MAQTLLFLILIFAVGDLTAEPKRKAKASDRGNCRAELESLPESAILDNLAGSHVRDVMASQMHLLQDNVRKRLMAQRRVESSPALRTEAEKLVFTKLFAEAGKKGKSADAYQKLSDPEKEAISRSLFVRIGHFANLAKSREADWFSKDLGDSIPEDYFEAKATWVDPARVQAWVDELVGSL